MSENAASRERSKWLESCSFVQIFRTFRLAIHPTKLALALVGLLLTLVWGGWLDWLWQRADRGVTPDAIWVHAGFSEGTGQTEGETAGVFESWRRYEAWCLGSALASARHGQLWTSGLATVLESGPPGAGGEMPSVAPIGLAPCVLLMGKGFAWLITQHWLFALLLLLGSLALWALPGGAICRIAAVQYARDEKIAWRDALGFAWQRYLSGFFLAPLLPVLLVLFVAFMLALGGAFLRIPYVGDVLGSLLFVLAVLGGAVAALIMIGMVAGGSLFWPTIAAEGSESLDAVSRSFNYVGTTPWRTLFYGLVATVYGSLCYLFVKWFAYLILACTHAFVGFGTAPFGWWLYESGQAKLDVLWPAPTFGALHSGVLETSGIETFSGAVVGIWVFLLILLVWAFLASFYFCGSTVVYFLLRRDNDTVDLEDVYLEDYAEEERAPTTAPPPQEQAAPQPGAEVQATAESEPAPSASPAGTEDSPQADTEDSSDDKDDDSPPGPDEKAT